jgi:hypothetical protein
MLNSRRASNGFGVNPLQFSEILAYYELQGVMPQPWDVEILVHFDNVVMSIYAEKSKSDADKKKNKK